MQNVRLIKGRIKSAKNIAQITKAMELVAASKMKKARIAAEAGRQYAEKIREMVLALGNGVDVSAHPLLAKPKAVTGKRLGILISTNKGLCGGLNSTLFRNVLSWCPDISRYAWITLGLKGAMFLGSMKSQVIADFSHHATFTGLVPAVTELSIEQFLSGGVDGVDLFYNDFQSVLRQKPTKKPILPLTIEGELSGQGANHQEFLIEPNADEVFASLLPHYIENQIRDALYEAEASEQAARMIAMRNATDNAKSFIQELTLVYNKVRQEKITYEISDLVTARAAIVSG